ncbi:Transposase [Anaerocolumna jejuensis DSM 15929]|uniref:Transposase n=1 Tax=Anaerocolumna jejuensis DSM 15929 TaxID=1121322 RepID=A0A1M7DTI9_9FIRM|nr:Transposase [Anaerocolumna jejuensis DSM 15929]
MNRKSSILGLEPIYGLENAYGYGRSLAVWLIENGYIVKDINPALAYDQRKSAPMYRKNDEHDAYCVATVMINQLHTLPDAKPKDNEWTLAQLVNALYHEPTVSRSWFIKLNAGLLPKSK